MISQPPQAAPASGCLKKRQVAHVFPAWGD
jgi:hypothetical protein